LHSFKTAESISQWVQKNKAEGKTIGFVPTMGALHEGHLELVQFASRQCDAVVVSVFVNPTQFNSSEDLEKYPRNIENDTKLLMMTNCEALFIPDVETIYPDYPNNTERISIDFKGVDKIMEGQFRPGHFAGVVNVVHRLFELIQPNIAYFGEKDFQQLAIIRMMVKQCKLTVEIQGMKTIREETGLAMSSRNQRLTVKAKEESAFIYKAMHAVMEMSNSMTPEEAEQHGRAMFQGSNLDLEYFQIFDPLTLERIKEQWVPGARVAVAAYIDGVRLIDNMQVFH
jgi:pantoate--beta-alanine ligase